MISQVSVFEYQVCESWLRKMIQLRFPDLSFFLCISQPASDKQFADSLGTGFISGKFVMILLLTCQNYSQLVIRTAVPKCKPPSELPQYQRVRLTPLRRLAFISFQELVAAISHILFQCDEKSQ